MCITVSVRIVSNKFLLLLDVKFHPHIPVLLCNNYYVSSSDHDHGRFPLQHARQLRFGANLNRFEDIGVDLNAGVCIIIITCVQPIGNSYQLYIPTMFNLLSIAIP